MSLMSLTNSSRNLESASLLLMRPRPESPLKVLPNTEKEDMPPDLISETSSHRFFGKLILFSSWTVEVHTRRGVNCGDAKDERRHHQKASDASGQNSAR